MAYVKQEWFNLPEKTTPISADRLNHLETQYDEAVALTLSRSGVNVSDFGAKGDGFADDAPALKAAFQAGAGGTVHFPAGKVFLVKSAIPLPSATVFEFNGSEIRRAFNDSPAGRTLFGVNNTFGVVLRGGILNGNGGSYPSSPDGFNIVTGTNVNSFTVDECTFRDVVGNHAIDLQNTNGISVRDSRFEGFKDNAAANRGFSEAIQLDPGIPAGGTPSRDWKITGCTFTTSPTQGFGPWPAGVGNHATASSKSGETYDVLISGNVFNGCTFNAVRVFSWDGVTVSGNTFRGCAIGVQTHPSSSGFNPSRGVVISGNSFQGTSGTSVFAIGVDGLTVADNVIQGGATGIRLEFTANTTVSGNSVQNVTQNALFVAETFNSSMAGQGLTRNIAVTGNTFRDCGFRGAHFNCAGRDLSFVGNTLVGMSTAASSRSCVQADSGWSGGIFSGNLTADGGGAFKPTYGLQFLASSSRITVGSNLLWGATGPISNQSV